MKVIEVIHNSRTEETVEFSWGNDMNPVSVIQSVAAILDQQRAREDGTNESPFAQRLTTLSIHIEL